MLIDSPAPELQLSLSLVLSVVLGLSITHIAVGPVAHRRVRSYR